MKRIFFALAFLAIITTGLTVNAQDSTRAAKKHMKAQKHNDKAAAHLEKKESKPEKEKKNPQPDGVVSGKDNLFAQELVIRTENDAVEEFKLVGPLEKDQLRIRPESGMHQPCIIGEHFPELGSKGLIGDERLSQAAEADLPGGE